MYLPGIFNSLKTESTLSIVVDRATNQENISCFIEENKTQDRLEEQITLRVYCECSYYFV